MVTKMKAKGEKPAKQVKEKVGKGRAGKEKTLFVTGKRKRAIAKARFSCARIPIESSFTLRSAGKRNVSIR